MWGELRERGRLELFEGSGEVLSDHIRGFYFGVNNPNSIFN